MLKRRIFLLVLFMIALLLPAHSYAAGKERKGTVELTVTIDAPEGSRNVRLWLPYPVSDGHQTISDVKISGNYTSEGIYAVPSTGALALYAEWSVPAKERRLTITFNADARERVMKSFPSTESVIPVEVLPYLEGTRFIPVDGKIKEVSLKITEGKKSIKDKAEAVYDWVVENTFRDPDVQGCGVGDVEVTLAKRGGKCADISSVFVALARASGVPAREVFGLRLGKKAEEDMTGGHHCWAEFYLPGYGWVPVDPADVRKIMLVEKLELKEAKAYRDYYFGAVDPYRIALGKGGRGIYLSPVQNAGPLNYFMYPYAEVDGKALEWLAAQKELKFKVSFKEIK
jgi:transglutaminase-like putative cysteine protease